MEVDALRPAPHAAVADLSFRSLRGAAAKILSLTQEGWMIALIKPQFEWVQPPPDFQGVVPDECLQEILATLEADLREEGVTLTERMPSAVRGRRGNLEFLGRLVRR